MNDPTHKLTLGITLSGKSVLNKAWCAGLRDRGIRTAVLDPLRSKWAADYQTHDPEAFLRHVKTSQHRLALFVDESASSIDKYDPRFDWLGTTGRHLGHLSHVIAHRYVQVSPTLRAQLTTRFVFRVERNDAEQLASAHGQELLAAADLPKLHFLMVEPFAPVRRGRIEFVRGKPKIFLDVPKATRGAVR